MNYCIENNDLDIEEHFYILSKLSKFSEDEQFFVTDDLNGLILKEVLKNREGNKKDYLRLFEVSECFRKYKICSDFYEALYKQNKNFIYDEVKFFAFLHKNLSIKNINDYVKRIIKGLSDYEFFNAMKILKMQNVIDKSDILASEIKNNLIVFKIETLEKAKFVFKFLLDESQEIQEFIFTMAVLDSINGLIAQLVKNHNKEWLFFAYPLKIKTNQLSFIQKPLQFFIKNHKILTDEIAQILISNVTLIEINDLKNILFMIFSYIQVEQFFRILSWFYETNLRGDKNHVLVLTIKSLILNNNFKDNKSLEYICDNIKNPSYYNLFIESDLENCIKDYLISILKNQRFENFMILKGLDRKTSISLVKKFITGSKHSILKLKIFST